MKADVYPYKNEKQNAAVVFIHGFTGDVQKTWGNFPEFLKQHPDITDWDIFSIGYPTSLFALESRRIWFAYPSLRTLADSLRTRIAYPPFDRYENLAFVAHSMGGLIVQRALMDDPRIFEKVSHLFMFGTPSTGLLKASFGAELFRKSQVRDMADRGEFIISLRRQWEEKVNCSTGFHFKAVRGMNDEFVSEPSCHSPFPQNVRETVPGSHLEIVKPNSPDHLSVQIVVKGLRQKRTAPASSKSQKTHHSEDKDDPAEDKDDPDCPDNPLINLDSMPPTDPDLFGREEELELLDRAWEDTETKILVFAAMGGAGKTSLVNVWLHSCMAKQNFRGAARVYAWSFYSQGAAEGRQASADLFLNDALKWFGDDSPEQSSPAEKGRSLAELFRKQKNLLVLDGLEPVQHPPGPQEGRIKDEGLRTLLRNLAVQNPGLCLITTRLKVDDLKTFTRSSVKEKILEHLSESAGVMLLNHLHVTGQKEEMRKAVQDCKGHALALTLLGTYLKTVHGGDVRQRDKILRLAYTGNQQGKHARRVMDSYEKWMENTETGRRMLSVLRIMGLFDRPAAKGAMHAVLAEPCIAGLTEDLQGISEADWAFAVEELRNLRLLLPVDACEKENPALDCHPLIREHFSEKLKKENPQAWKQAHSRLYEYFKNLPEKELPDTLEEMEPLFAAVMHGCMAEQHQEVLYDVYWTRIRRGNEGYSVKKLGAFGADLAALSHFFEAPWRKPAKGLTDQAQSVVLSWAGFHLRAMGRLHEAAEPMQAGMEVSIHQEDWKGAAQDASSLSELHLTIGHVQKAVDYGRESVAFADRSGDGFQKESKRTALADALHQAGELTEAEALFQEAEAMQKERQPKYHFLYSLQGFQFCDLLLSRMSFNFSYSPLERGRGVFGNGEGHTPCPLSRGEFLKNLTAIPLRREEYKEVLERAGQTLEWAIQQGTLLLDIALDNLSLGRCHLLRALAENTNDFRQAETYLNLAVEGLRESGGSQHHLPRGLLARAALFRAKKEFENALTDLNEAREIAEYGGMKLFLTDYHLETCRLCLAQNKPGEAQTHLQTAKTLIAQTGYNRRLKDVEELSEP